MIAAFPGCQKWTKTRGAQPSPDDSNANPRHRTVRRRRMDFLTAYAECGNVSEACRRSRTSRSTHYLRLQRDEAYRLAFFSAHEEAEDRLLEEARRRAMGWQEPVIIDGKHVGYVSKHSDRLLMLLLQYYMPEKFGYPGRRRRHRL